MPCEIYRYFHKNKIWMAVYADNSEKGYIKAILKCLILDFRSH